MMRAALLALLGTSALAYDLPFTTCGDDSLGLERLSISDYPIKVGGAVDMKVSFTPKQKIRSAKFKLTIMHSGQKLVESTVDMCEDASITCPLEEGKEVTVSQTQTVPVFVPKGVYQAHITATDGETGAELTCIDADMEIVHAYSKEELSATPAVTGTLLANINMAKTTWTAHWSPKFANATLAHAARLCGTMMRGHPQYKSLPLRKDFAPLTDELPANFDAREHWTQCKDVIGHVRDQSACGSCWAFATTEALNDRLCITHDVHTLLSPTDTAACCTGAVCGFSQGCNGGQPSGAWEWFSTTGVVTGGDQIDEGNGASCLPYPFPSCAHHVDPTPEHPACPDGDYVTPRCTQRCSEDSYGTAYRADKHKGKSAYAVRGEAQIKQEIFERGTVTAALTVYEDFLVYEKGVYAYTSGSPLGGHAIKMIGWGEENGVAYWLCVNSWNDSWGENGTFKIRRGTNECGIESEIAAGSV